MTFNSGNKMKPKQMGNYHTHINILATYPNLRRVVSDKTN